MKNKIPLGYLVISGAVMFLVGMYIAITTGHYFSEMSLLEAKPSINLISDLRGMGGLLLLFGLYICASVFVASWRDKALWVSAFVYCAFVLFRGVSFVVDGVPGEAVLVAFGLEVLLGGLGLMVRKASVK